MNNPGGTSNYTNVNVEKRSKVRYAILIVLFLSTAINYLDRTNIFVAAPVLKSVLHLNPILEGFIFSASL